MAGVPGPELVAGIAVVVVAFVADKLQLPLLFWPVVLRPGEFGETPLIDAMATLEYGDVEGDLFVFELFAMAAVVEDEAVVVEFSEVDDDEDEFDEDEEDDDDDDEEEESNEVVEQTNGPKELLLLVLFGVGASLWFAEEADK